MVFKLFIYDLQVVLNSMHKYQPRIHVIRITKDLFTLQNLSKDNYKTFIFPETQFTAVTAYQNQLVSHDFIILFDDENKNSLVSRASRN